jgi:glyoxylase-like metal-dependent hydrolase (beta-lactamase superfamily II)
MRKMATGLLVATAFVCACTQPAEDGSQATNAEATAKSRLSLTRLDCGTATIKDFDAFFSDKPGLYAKGPREVSDGCYVIRHGDQTLLWDTSFPASLAGSEKDMGPLIARLDKSVAQQLRELGINAADIDIVGISHMHSDHTGQAAEFPNARLIIGKGDFEQTKGKDDPFGPWRKEGANLTAATADVDVFGDGSVVAVHLPGHTPDHLALLVRLASGPVLLSGDMYHSREAREKRGVPPFNTSREQTLASMDKFEKLAKETGAKVVIQHEPRDIELLPAFPQAAGD